MEKLCKIVTVLLMVIVGSYLPLVLNPADFYYCDLSSNSAVNNTPGLSSGGSDANGINDFSALTAIFAVKISPKHTILLPT